MRAQMASTVNLSALDHDNVSALDDATSVGGTPIAPLSLAARKASVADSLDSVGSPTSVSARSSRDVSSPAKAFSTRPLHDVVSFDRTHSAFDRTASGNGEAAPRPASGASSAIPIKSSSLGRKHSCCGMSPGSVSSSVGTSLLDSAPRDFTLRDKSVPEPADTKLLHVTSPSMYMHNLKTVGLELIDFRDLSEHLSFFYEGMVDEVRPSAL